VDTGTDQHTFALARKLGWTMLSGVSKIVALDAGSITVERELEEGRQTVRAALPAVITVTKEINEPRFPSFIGIRKASKAAIPTWSLADLGVSAAPAGVRVTSFRNLPARNVTLELIAGTPEEMARTLVDRLIEEKVL
jgi:electron transfer flavoprotein beta subunit